MLLQRLNRYCGIVLKKGSWPEKLKPSDDLPLVTQAHEYYRIYHSNDLINGHIFDGLLYNTDQLFTPNVSHYEGNWSMAFQDDETLLLSRDRVGVRTLYYVDHDEYFAFSNEIKHLFNLRLHKFEVSSSAVFRFLFLDEQDIIGDSLFKGVNEIPPGHRLIYNLKVHSFQVEPYVDNQKFNYKKDDLSKSEIELKEKIGKPIHQILSEIESPGALLSGGMDSSVMAAEIMKHEKGQEIPFITAISNYEQLNETPFAASVIQHFEIKNWNQVVVNHLEKGIEELHYAMEFPTLSAGSFMQFELFRFAGFKNIQYLFDGTGADALFGGHQYYQVVYWNELLKSGQFKRFRKEVDRKKLGYFWLPYFFRNIAKYYTRGLLPAKTKYRTLLSQNGLLRNLNPEFVNQNLNLLSANTSRKMDNLNYFLKEDFFNGGVTRLLRFPDRIGKYFGVVNCSIFSDNEELFEYALDLPASFKIKQGVSKFILRDAYSDELPDKVINRKDKMGLVAPNNHWLVQHKQFFLDYFTDDLEGFFDVPKMKHALANEIDQLTPQENYKLFKFVSFAIWHKVFKQKYNQ